MSVPREAMVAVRSFDPTTSEIILTGDQSAAAVAEWLETPSSIPLNFALDIEHPTNREEARGTRDQMSLSTVASLSR